MSTDLQAPLRCPACEQPFAAETIAGVAASWCPRCAVLCAGEDDLERIATALRSRRGSSGDLASLLPAASADASLSLRTPCPACGGKLYVQDRFAWLTCGGCERRYVPRQELAVLVDDPALARQRPLDMPHKLTPKEQRADQRAFTVLGFLSFVGALASFVGAAYVWRLPVPPGASIRRHATYAEVPIELFILGCVLVVTGFSLVWKVRNPGRYWKERAVPGHGDDDAPGQSPAP